MLVACATRGNDSPRRAPSDGDRTAAYVPSMASAPGTAHVTLARQVAELVWRQHFRIPEPAYWMALVVASLGFYAGTTLEAFAWAGLLALSVVGIARWRWHRRRSKALVVARSAPFWGRKAWRSTCRNF